MDASAQYDNKELLLLISQGDKDAFAQVFKTYCPPLTAFISRIVRSDYVTDEIIQETFMRIWYNREKLMDIKDPKTWIYGIVADACYSFLQQLFAGKKITSTVHREFYYDDKNEIFEVARLHKLAADIHEAVHELTPEQKKVYKLSREKGLKTAEIAEQLSTSPNIVRSILHSSMGFMSDYLHHKGHSF
jgi:RNA polymerase sigma factor (sigma-70 family)